MTRKTRKLLHGALGLAVLSLAFAPIRIAADAEEADRVRESVTVFNEIMAAPDKAIPNSVLEKTEGIAVFPGTLKGGFIIGGQHGRGILSARVEGSRAWSVPGFMTVTGGSFGAQIGAQAVDLVLVVINKRGLQKMMSNEFKVGADAGVAAGPVGRDASVGTDIQMHAEILSYSRSRGLFAGINLNGSSIRSDDDANQRFYGKSVKTADIISKPMMDAPAPAKEWQATLAKYAK
jgi:lipid-binding SYLF domain-containing protein